DPDTIVRSSLGACSQVKNTMLNAYPERWRENYLKEVDTNLYQREMEWIVETRTKNNRFFQ
ncbi:MAG: hypothetical protein PVJ72_15055, partial [Gammaproteobacteria bacterium]